MGGAAAAGAIADAAVQGASTIANNAVNYHIQNKNLGFQKQAMILNLLLQQKAWRREDTAVQRRAADLIAAGFSPVLAAGSPASTMSPIKIEPMHNDFRSNIDVQTSFTNAMLANAQIDKVTAETEKVRQQQVLDLVSFPDRLNKIQNSALKDLQSSRLIAIQQLQQWLDADYQKKTNFKAGQAGEVGKAYSDMQKIIDQIKQKYYDDNKVNRGAQTEDWNK